MLSENGGIPLTHAFELTEVEDLQLLGLIEDALELTWPKHLRKVEKSTGDCRDRDSRPLGGVVGMHMGCTVDSYTNALPTACGHMNSSSRSRQQIPQSASAPVTEKRALPAGEYSGQPPSVAGESRVATFAPL